MKKIALVTVNFGGTKDTLELLDSIKRLDTNGFDFKAVIVDSTPDDWIGDHIIKKPEYVDLLQLGENKGFAGNYNTGMKYAIAWGADYVLAINNDTLVGSGNLIKKLAQVLEENPEASAVSPKILFAPGYEFYKTRYSESEKGHVIWYAGGKFDWANVRSIHKGIDEVDTGKYDMTERTGFISGCCFMVRRKVLETIGYFDEELFAYFEDNDWQQRILKNGGKLYYTGQAHIYHKVSQTAGIGTEQTDYLLTRNRLYFTFKYAGFRTKFAVIREMMKLLVMGRPAQKKAILDFIQGIKGQSPYTKIFQGIYKYPVRLSILISNYKTLDLTEKLLESIYNKNSGFDAQKDEVIVVDDASGDDLKSLAKKFPKTILFKNENNLGFVASYNRLLELARGEYILMLNSDIEVKPKSLSILLEQCRKLNNKAVLTGKLLFPDGKPQDSCFKLPTAWGAFKEYFLKIKGSYFMFRPEASKPVKVEGAVMADFFIPRKVFNKIGFLNKKLFMYFEDIDYCRRLKNANISIYFCPDAQFYHHHGASSQRAGGLNKQLIESSKIYHGPLNYFILTFVLWLGQKIKLVETPA